jgi:hypothetical protein
MSLFIEVDSIEKGCKVIINLDEVLEIAPLAAGGCALFFATATGNKVSFKVRDSYELFKQFVLQTVSVDDIAKKVKNLKASTPAPTPEPDYVIPTLGTPK